MGEQNIREGVDQQELRNFTRQLLDDVAAMERMIGDGLLETGKRRIGAEQEMFAVDGSGAPSRLGPRIIEEARDPRFTTELGQFNLEANLTPLEYGGSCLRALETELDEVVGKARGIARGLGGGIVLAGILPTLSKEHLTLDWMTPYPRYFALNEVMVRLRRGEFWTHIKGLDQLQTSHDNILLEACNTSFQVHFQVSPDEFARLYNLAQAVTPVVLAAAVNSPLLLKHRLWHETRVALFQQSVDARSVAHQKRGAPTRVSFGDRWVKDSVLEIYREDIARFRVMLATDYGESATKLLDRGEIPPLRALSLHNGTVYRWNRPCYGVKDGVAHLRIENRVLPSGPTVVDEVANAAFFFGLMSALGEETDDVSELLDFDGVKGSFMSAARYGLDARVRWLGGGTVEAGDLILKQLLPLAREGLASRKIDSQDIDRYLGVLQHRVELRRTGAQWMLGSLAAMEGQGSPEEIYRALTRTMVDRQTAGDPVYTWDMATVEESKTLRWIDSYRTVGQVMRRDVFTIHPEDVIDLAASMMDWERLRQVPVEDEDGHLVGILSHRTLLRTFARPGYDPNQPLAVGDVMRKAHSVTVDTPLLDAIELMVGKGVGSLPVVDDDGKLVGMVTESDFMQVAQRVLQDAFAAAERNGR